MGRHFAKRRRSRNTRGSWWAWLLFLCGVVVFGWGCTTQTKNQRNAKRGDGVGLDQYDRYMGDDRNPRRRDPQRRRYTSRHNSRQGSWLDGNDPGHSRRYQPQRRMVPRSNTPTGTCLQMQQLAAQRHCLFPLLTQGAKASRQGHLKALLGQGYRGTKAVFSMLQKGEVGLRTFIMRSILHDSVYVRTQSISLVSALYKIAKQDFLEALSVLPTNQKLQVASRLMLGLRFVTRKRVTREFGAYLRLPAGKLWTRIQQETALPTSMALVSLSGCAKGQHKIARPYTQAMESLQQYYVTWHVWNYAAKASGMRGYLAKMRAFRSGRTRYRPRPRINKRALRLAIVLARRLQKLKPNTKKAILGVGAVIPRERMKNWFSVLVSKSPKLRRRSPGSPAGPTIRTKPKPNGKIEL